MKRCVTNTGTLGLAHVLAAHTRCLLYLATPSSFLLPRRLSRSTRCSSSRNISMLWHVSILCLRSSPCTARVFLLLISLKNAQQVALCHLHPEDNRTALRIVFCCKSLKLLSHKCSSREDTKSVT